MRIIGLGQPAAGDDGVGPAVIQALGDVELPDDVEVSTARNPGELVDLLRSSSHAILVDAVVDTDAPGSVLVLEPEQLAAQPSLSSHGLGVAEAVALARVLDGGARVEVVAIGIRAPRAYGTQLSPAVQASVLRARQIAIELALAPCGSDAARERA